MSRHDKHQRKEMLGRWKSAQRDELVASMPLTPDQLRRLLDFLEANLKSCDHAMKLTAIFLHVEKLDKNKVLSWLGEQGGYSHCRRAVPVSFNVRRRKPQRIKCHFLGAQNAQRYGRKRRHARMDDIDYGERFDTKWNEFTRREQQAINAEIKRLLDTLIDAPDPQWGSIMNTSILGGADNPFTGEPGDWSDTPWAPIWERHGQSSEQAALFFGTLWKLRIIERPELWIGIRSTDDNPTFPNRGINLAGKTYFLPKKS